MYELERGTATVSGRQTSWYGNIGLMHPSDFYTVYGKGVNNVCYTKTSSYYECNKENASTSWIFNSNVILPATVVQNTGFLSGDAGSYNIYRVSNTGYFGALNAKTFSIWVRPVLYLSADVKIIGGTGQSTDPYKLSL